MIDADKELAKIAAAAKPAAKKTGEKKSARPTEQLTLVLRRSGICAPKDQKATLEGLGLRRLGQRVVRPDAPAIRGMIHKVRHLVEIEKS